MEESISWDACFCISPPFFSTFSFYTVLALAFGRSDTLFVFIFIVYRMRMRKNEKKFVHRDRRRERYKIDWLVG